MGVHGWMAVWMNECGWVCMDGWLCGGMNVDGCAWMGVEREEAGKGGGEFCVLRGGSVARKFERAAAQAMTHKLTEVDITVCTVVVAIVCAAVMSGGGGEGGGGGKGDGGSGGDGGMGLG
eukprot:264026-Chlamydomonas_euryale.AAC.1